MDIISAMDRSAMDRFSWNYADIIVVSSWKIPATFWAGKIFIYSRKFKNHAGKAICEVVCPPPFFLRKIGGDGRHFVREYRQMFVWAFWMSFAAQTEASCAQICWQKNTPLFLLVFGGKLTCLAAVLHVDKACMLRSAPSHRHVRVNPSPPPTAVSALGGE